MIARLRSWQNDFVLVSYELTAKESPHHMSLLSIQLHLGKYLNLTAAGKAPTSPHCDKSERRMNKSLSNHHKMSKSPRAVLFLPVLKETGLAVHSPATGSTAEDIEKEGRRSHAQQVWAEGWMEQCQCDECSAPLQGTAGESMLVTVCVHRGVSFWFVLTVWLWQFVFISCNLPLLIWTHAVYLVGVYEPWFVIADFVLLFFSETTHTHASPAMNDNKDKQLKSTFGAILGGPLNKLTSATLQLQWRSN